MEEYIQKEADSRKKKACLKAMKKARCLIILWYLLL